MNEYDFSMFIIEENGEPVIVMRVTGCADMDAAEEVADDIFSVIHGTDEPEQELH
jgi:hypothetical protein